MPAPSDPATVAILLAQAGLSLRPEQIASVAEGYALIQPLLDRLHAPLPREAEPSLTFTPEQA